MTHAKLLARLSDYLDGELPLSERARVDRHLDGCERCRRELRELRETVALLRRLPEPDPPADFADAVMRRIRAAEGRRSWLARWRRAARAAMEPRLSAPIAALAATALVVLLLPQLNRTLPGFRRSEWLATAPAREGGAREREVSDRAVKRLEPPPAQARRFERATAGPARRSAVGVERPDEVFELGPPLPFGLLGPVEGMIRASGVGTASYEIVSQGSREPATSPLGSAFAGRDAGVDGAKPSGSALGGAPEASRESDRDLRRALADPSAFVESIGRLPSLDRQRRSRELADHAARVGASEEVARALRATGRPLGFELARLVERRALALPTDPGRRPTR